jgi:hypothetical protein
MIIKFHRTFFINNLVSGGGVVPRIPFGPIEVYSHRNAQEPPLLAKV